MNTKKIKEIIRELRKNGEFKGYEHRRHRKKIKKTSPIKIKVEQMKEKNLLNEINELR